MSFYVSEVTFGKCLSMWAGYQDNQPERGQDFSAPPPDLREVSHAHVTTSMDPKRTGCRARPGCEHVEMWGDLDTALYLANLANRSNPRWGPWHLQAVAVN